MSAEHAQVVRAWQETIAKGPEAMEKSLKKVKAQSQETGATLGGMLRSSLADVGRFGLQIAGIGSTIGGLYTMATLLRNEYDELIRRRQSAADVQLSVAEAQWSANRALGQDPSMSKVQLEQRIIALTEKTGRDPVDLFQRADSALGSRGPAFPADRALRTVETVAGLGAVKAEDAKRLGGAVIDVQKVRPELEAEDILGSMLAGHEFAHVDEVGDYAYNVNPLVVQGMQRGDSFEFLTAMMSTMTQMSVDKTGRTSRNAMTRMMVQLAENIGPILGVDSTFEQQYEWLVSGNPEANKMRSKLMGIFSKEANKKDTNGELSLEAKQYFSVMDLLTHGSATQQMFRQAQRDLPKIGQGSREYLAKEQQGDAGLVFPQIYQLSKAFKGAELALQLGDMESFKAEAAKGLENTLRASGAGDLASKIAKTEFNLAAEAEGVNSVEDVRARLESSEQRLRGNTADFKDIFFGVAGTPPGAVPPSKIATNPPTEADIRAADALDKLGNRLDELITLMKANEQAKAQPAPAINGHQD